jgi:hypothetical protein
MSSEGCAAHPVCYNSLMQNLKKNGNLTHFLLYLNFLGVRCRLKWLFGALQVKNKCAKRPLHLLFLKPMSTQETGRRLSGNPG